MTCRGPINIWDTSRRKLQEQASEFRVSMPVLMDAIASHFTSLPREQRISILHSSKQPKRGAAAHKAKAKLA